MKERFWFSIKWMTICLLSWEIISTIIFYVIGPELYYNLFYEMNIYDLIPISASGHIPLFNILITLFIFSFLIYKLRKKGFEINFLYDLCAIFSAYLIVDFISFLVVNPWLLFFRVDHHYTYEILHQGFSYFIYLFFIIWLLFIAGGWYLYEKAGQKGWKSLVPIYNLIILCRIAKKPEWYTLIILLVPIANIVFLIMLYNGLSKQFGKGAEFTVGLVLARPIFISILGYGKAKYIQETF
jgi:hypothetical protein